MTWQRDSDGNAGHSRPSGKKVYLDQALAALLGISGSPLFSKGFSKGSSKDPVRVRGREGLACTAGWNCNTPKDAEA